MDKTIFAHTAPGSNHPGFVNIREKADGTVVVSVRNPVTGTGDVGSTAELELPREQGAALKAAVTEWQPEPAKPAQEAAAQ